LHVRALAIRRNPHLFTRAQGQLRQEPGASRAQRRRIVHQGDEIALKAYIEAHRNELVEEVRAAREQAEAESLLDVGLPTTQKEWVSFLEENQSSWRRALETAPAERGKLSARIQARAGLGAAPRLNPELGPGQGWAPQWAHLEAGFYCLETPLGELYWCYVASIGRTVYAMPLSLYDAPMRLLSVSLLEPFHKAFGPISLALRDAGVPDNSTTKAHVLEVAVHEFRQDSVLLKVVGAEPARNAPARRVDGVPAGGEEEVGEMADCDFLKKLAGLGSDAESEGDSIVSSDEPSSDGDLDEDDEGEADDDDGGVGAPRKPPGTHVVDNLSNQYFTFVDNRGFPDVKVLLRPRWATAEFLGGVGVEKSKTMTPHKVGDLRERPVRSFLVLRAWALGRFRQNGFHLTKSVRKKFLERETAALLSACRAHAPVGQLGVGNAVANEMIWEYARAVLPASFPA
jgi:hypothetical protein